MPAYKREVYIPVYSQGKTYTGGVILCGSCGLNLADEGKNPSNLGYLLYTSKKNYNEDLPYEIYCGECIKNKYPEARFVEIKTMFDITPKKIAPIMDYVRRYNPDVDFTKMGDWGIVFLCCGAMSVQTRAGRAIALDQFSAPVSFIAALKGGDDEYFAGRFANFIEKWSQDPLYIASTKHRLEALGGISEKSFPVMLSYFTIAITLNSLTELDTGDFGELKNWVEKSELGWPGFFYAAGIYLSNSPYAKIV